MRQLEAEFEFAGFTWPRYVARMACGVSALKRKYQGRKVCGEYYHAPKPGNNSRGFYLESGGQPFTRWYWCDDVKDAGIDHTGWFCDDDHCSKIRGIVAHISHGRYLAGWSMGGGMASGIEYRVFHCPIDAARYADSLAESVAESEREYQESKG